MITKSEVKYIQSLAHKKFREEEGLFIVEGFKMVEELLQESPNAIERIYATKEWLENHSKYAFLQEMTIVVEEHEIAKISQLVTADEVLALVKIPKTNLSSLVEKGVTLVLDQIQDPGNLGTIIRTCDWFGIGQIVCSPDTVDAFNPKVVQSAKGSLLRVQIRYTPLVPFLAMQKKLPIYATILNGRSIHEVSFKRPAILLIGNEANGISPEVLAFASENITIPKYGKAESLNAAIASAIILTAMMK